MILFYLKKSKELRKKCEFFVNSLYEKYFDILAVRMANEN
jgi:hypothetical protein